MARRWWPPEKTHSLLALRDQEGEALFLHTFTGFGHTLPLQPACRRTGRSSQMQEGGS